jgi:hypothetical protein
MPWHRRLRVHCWQRVPQRKLEVLSTRTSNRSSIFFQSLCIFISLLSIHIIPLRTCKIARIRLDT